MLPTKTKNTRGPLRPKVFTKLSSYANGARLYDFHIKNGEILLCQAQLQEVYSLSQKSDYLFGGLLVLSVVLFAF